MKKIGVLLLVCLMSVAAQAGLGLVDDFSGDLSAYTLSRVNDGNGEANVLFSNVGGDLRVSYSGANKHEQVLFLRDDYTLGVGEMLLATIAHMGDGWDRDLGIAVGYSETPPALAVGESADVRTSYVEVSFRSNNQVMTYARDGATNLASGQVFPGIVDVLYIMRTGDRDFALGYINDGVKTLVKSYTITTDPLLGAAIGFYADVRVAISGSPVGLDNLQIVPEPATMLLLGIGSVLALRRRK